MYEYVPCVIIHLKDIDLFIERSLLTFYVIWP